MVLVILSLLWLRPGICLVLADSGRSKRRHTFHGGCSSDQSYRRCGVKELMFGKKDVSAPLQPATRDGPSKAAEAFRGDAEPSGDVGLLQPLVQLRIILDEMAIALHRVVVSKGDLVRLLFNDPMALHVADVEGGDIGKVGDELLKGRKVILEHSAVFDRSDREEARLAE